MWVAFCKKNVHITIKLASWNRVTGGDPENTLQMGLIDHVTCRNAGGVYGPDTPLSNVSHGTSAHSRWPVLIPFFKRVREVVPLFSRSGAQMVYGVVSCSSSVLM